MSSSVPRWVVVDDTDPAIEYVGQWFQDTGSQDTVGNFGPAYLSSLHGTNHSASLAFSFNGSQVQLFGTNNVVNTSGVLDPSWDCFVDKIKTGATAPVVQPENHWILCEQDQLEDGPHTITLNATVSSQTFWFDQIQYVPSSSVSLDQKAIYIDNTDPGVQDAFGPGWHISGNVANMTNVTNSLFTLDFVGVSLTWYGVIRQELPITPTTGSFAIDGGTPQVFRLKGLSSGEITQYNQIFFQTQQVKQGKHTIVVTYLGDSTTTPLTLDYLIVQNGTAPSVTPPGNSTTAGNAGAGLDKHSHSSVGPIVGGVVGGLAVVAIIAVLIFLYLRRRRNKQESDDDNTIHPVIQPFQYSSVSTSLSPGSSYPSSSNRYQNQGGSSSTYSANVSTPATMSEMGRSSTSGAGSILSPPPPPPHIAQPTSKARREAEAVALAASSLNARGGNQANVSPTTSEPPSNNSRVIMHEDSGVRLPLPGIDEDVIEVPPRYTQI